VEYKAQAGMKVLKSTQYKDWAAGMKVFKKVPNTRTRLVYSKVDL